MDKNKVYISTGFYKKFNCIQVLSTFNKKKIFDIELSGGKYFTIQHEKKLKNISNNINVRLHNYFPPPKKKIVINLASLDRQVQKQSIKQIKKSIILSKKLGCKFFSFHAGFRIDPKPKKLGKLFNKYNIYNKYESEKVFYKNLLNINNFAKKNKIQILIENNVINKKNFKLFGENPLLLTNPNDILRFFSKLPKSIKLLLDVGHLKVSAKTENFNLEYSIKRLNKIVGGYHLSENDGNEDLNLNFTNKVWFMKYLRKDLNNYTLEIYNNNILEIKKTKKIVEDYLSS